MPLGPLCAHQVLPADTPHHIVELYKNCHLGIPAHPGASFYSGFKEQGDEGLCTKRGGGGNSCTIGTVLMGMSSNGAEDFAGITQQVMSLGKLLK